MSRTYKTETLNWDGSVYSTNKSFFNGRDQATTIRNYSGAETSTVFQETVVTYDEHGRLKINHCLEQEANTATTYHYYADDRIQQITDSKGATGRYLQDSENERGSLLIDLK